MAPCQDSLHVNDPEAIRAAVRAHYGAAARAASAPAQDACCGSFEKDVFSSDLYAIEDVGDLTSAAVLGSLGSGNHPPRRTSNRARWCSTWVRAAASTSCCRPIASGQQGSP